MVPNSVKAVHKVVRDARASGGTLIATTPLSVFMLSKIGQLHCKLSDQLSSENMHGAESWGLFWVIAPSCDLAKSRMLIKRIPH